MRVGDIMSTQVHRIAPDRSIEEARTEMSTRGVHHLVVAEGADVIGIISERDAAASTAMTVRDVMTTHVVRATVETTVHDAANLMRGHTIGCLPVFDGDRLTGIVTITDLLELIGRGVIKPVAESKRWTLRRRSPKRRPERVER